MCWLWLEYFVSSWVVICCELLLFVFRSSATYFASSLRKTLMKLCLLFVLRIALRRSGSLKLQSNWRSCYPGTEMIFLRNLNPQRWAKSLEIPLRKSSVWSDTHVTYRWSEMLSWVKFIEPVKLIHRSEFWAVFRDLPPQPYMEEKGY